MTASMNDLARAIDDLTADTADRGFLYAKRLISCIEQIREAPSHRTFAEICELALQAYPEGDLNKEAILRNGATPILVKYLLDSFKSYSEHAASGSEKQETHTRAKVLESAFGARSPSRGGNTKNVNWDDAKQMQITSIFSSAMNSSHSQGLPYGSAWQAGFDAAYEHAFGSDFLKGREPRQIKKNRQKLERLLNKHYPRSQVSSS